MYMCPLFNFEAFEEVVPEKQDDEEPPTCIIHYDNLEGSFEYEEVCAEENSQVCFTSI